MDIDPFTSGDQAATEVATPIRLDDLSPAMAVEEPSGGSHHHDDHQIARLHNLLYIYPGGARRNRSS